MSEMVKNYEFLLLLTDDHDCRPKPMSVKEGESVKVPLPAPGIIEDVCIWNNTTSVWENACQFSQGVCQPLLPYFREDISTKGNTFELKNASYKASGLYRLLNKSGNCMASMQISVLSKFVQVLFKAQMLRLGLQGGEGNSIDPTPIFYNS